MAFHVLSIAAAAYLCTAVTDELWRYYLIIGALALGSLYELMRMRFGGLFSWLFGFLQGREEEKQTRTASMDFVVAMSISAGLFSPRIAATSFMVVALADPFARIFGISFGSVRWPGSRKTIEGSAACFVVSFFTVMSCLQDVPKPFCALAALVATIAELLPQKVFRTYFGLVATPCDNFYIPIGTAALLAWAI